MILVDEKFVLNNRSNWQDAFKVAPVKIEILTLDKFIGQTFTLDTVGGVFTIERDKYIIDLLESPDNELRILTNVHIEKEEIIPSVCKQITTGKDVVDSWVVPLQQLRTLGYTQYKNGTYIKSPDTIVRVFSLNQPAKVIVHWSDSPIFGKDGDYVAIYGAGDYNIIDRDVFNRTYQFVG